MAIYTEVSKKHLQDWLNFLDLGNIENLTGIAEGIENSNYFLSTSKAHSITLSKDFVLTIFERTAPENLDFYQNWLSHLQQNGMSVPYPVASGLLQNKPALIATRLSGEKNLHPTARHCFSVGEWLAKLHLLGVPSNIPKQPRGITWQKEMLPMLQGKIAEKDFRLAKVAASKTWEKISKIALPRGAIHGDLFRDNLFFTPKTTNVSGVFDFFFGGEDAFIYDVAVAINDWCSYDSPDIQVNYQQQLINGYQSIRKITNEEHEILPVMMQFAALRFYLSRLSDIAFPRKGILVAHDPKRFADILTNRLTMR